MSKPLTPSSSQVGTFGSDLRAHQDADAKRAQQAALDLAAHVGNAGPAAMDLAGEQRVHHRGAAAVGDVLDVDAGAVGERRHGDVMDRAGTGGAVAQLAGVLLGERDEFGRRLRRQAGRHHERGRQRGDRGDRHEILQRVVGQAGLQRRVDGERAGIRQHQHMAVGVALATTLAATTPPAPGMFSTTNGLPSASVNFSASRRPSTSGLPPGPAGAIRRTGRFG